MDLDPEFEATGFSFDGFVVQVYPFTWNAVHILFDKPLNNIEPVEEWITRWLDVEDKNPKDKLGLSSAFHSFTHVDQSDKWSQLTGDLGRAPVEALLEFIRLLGSEGASKIVIQSSEKRVRNPSEMNTPNPAFIIPPRTLSSAQTYLMKVVFPIVWISMFGIGAIAMWVGTVRGTNDSLPPSAVKWQFLGIWIVGSVFILWGCAALKRVRVDSKNLYISNYRREISIPVTMIADVTENRWINIHPVTVHFHSVTEFGQKITFMPTVRYFTLWSSHPVVAELRSLAGLLAA
jgi:hypothetical protein